MSQLQHFEEDPLACGETLQTCPSYNTSRKTHWPVETPADQAVRPSAGRGEDRQLDSPSRPDCPCDQPTTRSEERKKKGKAAAAAAVTAAAAAAEEEEEEEEEEGENTGDLIYSRNTGISLSFSRSGSFLSHATNGNCEKGVLGVSTCV